MSLEEDIENYIDTIYEELKASIEGTQLCDTEGPFGPTGYQTRFISEYDTKEKRQLYLLHLYYAYVLEYYFIFKKLINESSEFKMLEKARLLSFGCGAGIDLYGLQVAIQDAKLSMPIFYDGFDIQNWEYRPSGNNISYQKINIGKIKPSQMEKGNILYFQRTLDVFSDPDFECFIDSIKHTSWNENNLFIIASFVRNNTIQISRYNEVCDNIISNGFTSIKTINVEHSKIQEKGLIDLFEKIQAPKKIKGRWCEVANLSYKLCNIDPKPNENDFCIEKNCHKPYFPITTTKFIATSISEYTMTVPMIRV